jgi:hypothetical protein
MPSVRLREGSPAEVGRLEVLSQRLALSSLAQPVGDVRSRRTAIGISGMPEHRVLCSYMPAVLALWRHSFLGIPPQLGAQPFSLVTSKVLGTRIYHTPTLSIPRPCTVPVNVTACCQALDSGSSRLLTAQVTCQSCAALTSTGARRGAPD